MRVAVDECEGEHISGNVYSMRLMEAMPFDDISDLLLKVEAVLDSQDFPRAFQRKRSFVESAGNPYPDPRYNEEDWEGYMDEETVNSAEGRYSTFVIQVITRQNASWQGYVDWLDNLPRQPYNSVLELLAMITERM